MSRPQKKHKPIRGDFNSILGAIAMGSGPGKKAAITLQSEKVGALKKPKKAKPKI